MRAGVWVWVRVRFRVMVGVGVGVRVRVLGWVWVRVRVRVRVTVRVRLRSSGMDNARRRVGLGFVLGPAHLVRPSVLRPFPRERLRCQHGQTRRLHPM